jgi:archaellum component FlaC
VFALRRGHPPNYIKRSKELLKIAGIIGIEHKSGEHSKTSIDALKEQINAVRATGKKLNSSLKALIDLPSSMAEFAQEKADLRKEVGKLKQKNLALDKLEKKGKISKNIIDAKRILNNENITTQENQISGINNELKSFGSGEKIKELRENIKNNLTEFKREVSKLETEIKSIEKGQAPKPPTQTLRPVRPAPSPPESIKKGQPQQFPQNNMGQQSQSTPQPRSEITNIIDQAIPEGIGLQAPLKPVLGKKLKNLKTKEMKRTRKKNKSRGCKK